MENSCISIRFCVQYPTYQHFHDYVINELLFAQEPIFGWETLYRLLYRRFKRNVFLSIEPDCINSDFQELLDRILPEYNTLWEINASDWLRNKSYDELLNEGLITTSETLDQTDDFKNSPQTKNVVDLSLDYLSRQFGRDMQTDKDTIQKMRPVYDQIARFFKNKVTYEFEQFYRDVIDIFVKYYRLQFEGCDEIE